jgi:hypothetical protein
MSKQKYHTPESMLVKLEKRDVFPQVTASLPKKEVISILMESPFYFNCKKTERINNLKRLSDVY